MRITARGMEFITDTLAEISESGQTFTCDLRKFRTTCERFKKALQPLKRKTKAELIIEYERLLDQNRALEDDDSDGTDTDTDSEMVGTESYDKDLIEKDPVVLITPRPEPSTLAMHGLVTPVSGPFDLNAVETPPRRLGTFNGSFVTPLRKAASMGDPRLVYPSPVSPYRPFVSQGTVFSTPPASPILSCQLDPNMVIFEEDELMDVDDGATMSLDYDQEVKNQRTITDLTTQVRDLTRALEDSNQSRNILKENIHKIAYQSVASEASRKALCRQLEECQNAIHLVQEENRRDSHLNATRIQESEKALEVHVFNEQARDVERRRLNDLLELRTREGQEYLARIDIFAHSMAPLMATLTGH